MTLSLGDKVTATESWGKKWTGELLKVTKQNLYVQIPFADLKISIKIPRASLKSLHRE